MRISQRLIRSTNHSPRCGTEFIFDVERKPRALASLRNAKNMSLRDRLTIIRSRDHAGLPSHAYSGYGKGQATIDSRAQPKAFAYDSRSTSAYAIVCWTRPRATRRSTQL